MKVWSGAGVCAGGTCKVKELDKVPELDKVKELDKVPDLGDYKE